LAADEGYGDDLTSRLSGGGKSGGEAAQYRQLVFEGSDHAISEEGGSGDD
jgi:hypothetical protein